jgi:hypothetical protein
MVNLVLGGRVHPRGAQGKDALPSCMVDVPKLLAAVENLVWRRGLVT